MLYRDSELCCFAARKGSSEVHLLVVTRQHFKSWKELIVHGEEGKRLLEKMVRVGNYCTGLEKEHPACSDSTEGIAVDGVESSLVMIPDITTEAGTLIPKVSQASDLLFGFHTPPHNSIDHIHLHVIDHTRKKPGFKNWIKYHPYAWWFKSMDAVLKDGDKNGWSDIKKR